MLVEVQSVVYLMHIDHHAAVKMVQNLLRRNCLMSSQRTEVLVVKE